MRVLERNNNSYSIPLAAGLRDTRYPEKLRVGWHVEWFPLQGFSCTSYSLIVFKVWASEYKTHFLKSVACHPCEIYLLRNKQAAGRSIKSVGCEPRS